MKNSKLLSSIMFLFFMTSFLVAEDLTDKLNISLSAEKYITNGREAKYQTIYYVDGNSVFDIIITNLSESNINIPDPSRYVPTLILTDSQGKKYKWPTPEGYGSSGGFVVIHLRRYESIIQKINFNSIGYSPSKKENEVTIQLIFSATLTARKKRFPEFYPEPLWEGTIKSEPRKFIIKNMSKSLEPPNEQQPKKRPQQPNPKKSAKFIALNIREVIRDTEIGHLEFNDASLNAVIMMLSMQIKDEVKIINTLNEEQQNKIQPISFKANDTTLEKVLSLICKKTGLKYVIGKDAVYIGLRASQNK